MPPQSISLPIYTAVVMSGKPTVISTFAGCGGSSLGYKWAGFEELLAIEWDNNEGINIHRVQCKIPIKII
jgi:DNA (cytosine-5)-methyltransferase 1